MRRTSIGALNAYRGVLSNSALVRLFAGEFVSASLRFATTMSPVGLAPVNTKRPHTSSSPFTVVRSNTTQK